MSISSRFVSAILVAGVSAAAALADESPKSLGTNGAWSAYEASTGGSKVCYTLAKPAESQPKGAKRGAIFVMISDWPDRKVSGEVEVTFGYPYKDGQKATAELGGKSVDFFTNNDGGNGQGWVTDADQESALVDSMRSGGRLTVKGISKRGTRTTDVYELDGLAASLDAVHAACK